jgi:hypothetical protein
MGEIVPTVKNNGYCSDALEPLCLLAFSNDQYPCGTHFYRQWVPLEALDLLGSWPNSTHNHSISLRKYFILGGVIGYITPFPQRGRIPENRVNGYYFGLRPVTTGAVAVPIEYPSLKQWVLL